MTAKPRLGIGTRVRLKSGGQDMLIVDADPVRSKVVAAWRDGDAVSEHEFNPDTLDVLQEARA